MESKSPLRRRVRTPEAASIIGCSPRTLEHYRLTGEGPPFHRVGPRLVVYDPAELERWLEERTYRSTSRAALG